MKGSYHQDKQNNQVNATHYLNNHLVSGVLEIVLHHFTPTSL